MSINKVIIRSEQAADYPAIKKINDMAFNQAIEGKIVDLLRKNCKPILSLVGELNHEIVGHILFSPISITGVSTKFPAMGLAPMAVHPKYQIQGIGSKLVIEGIEQLKKLSTPFVIVLGHPEFYPRFGFVKSSSQNLLPQWPNISDDVFMVKVFNKDAVPKVPVIARYRPEFDKAM